MRTALARTRERLDSYTLELQRHGLESVEREVRWLNELIATERRAEARAVNEGTTDTTTGRPEGEAETPGADDGPHRATDTDE
ncbi:hypothetical protein [Thermocatellispora tengchongensis]|uniref:hypothetical protein n=1 Tax=Thermocatellispora tengchongensis TaxID=1073253 RepID=UPI00364382F4